MKIIVAIDDSPYATHLMKSVCHRKWLPDTQFKLVSVVEQLDPAYTAVEDDIVGGVAKLMNERKAVLTHKCEEYRHQIEKAVPDCTVHFEIRQGDPRKEIIACSVDWEADRILIGAKGHDVCPHNLPGSVSHAVAQSAPCTVEIVRAAATHEKVGAR